MSIKTGRKLGFWAAISMLIGSVVGIGIFFKNGSISKMTNGNGATWLMAWIIGGVLALSLAISFSEIGTFKKESKTEGLAKWCSAVGGKKYGYFAQFQFSFFYTGLFVFVLGFFASEATLQGIVVAGLMNQYTVPIWGHALIGIGITTILVILNIISTKVSGIFQQITVVLKFIPLIMAALIGIIMSTTHNAIGTNANYPLLGTNAFGHGSFDAKAIVVALPAVLFAYDGFLNVATMQKKVKNGEKQIPKILFIGMIMVIIINSMISLASILHSAPSVDELFSDTFKKTASKVITIIVYVFICISAWGVVNGYAAGFWTSMEQATQTNLFFGMKTIKKKKSEFFVTLLYSFLIIAFWACILLIPSIILKTDSLIDSFSNWPTFFIFAILAITILFYTIKKEKNANNKNE
ncbi:APC family permease [Mycoplasma marinum]|uniref:Amino acid permease n=1 Tax=Mycoplasma marinum TaxID=1937190 RepID=A0A4R0XMD3_9MOLU|nr:amino acid permease [Mycoplasma marinum]TCG11872.1 hypothetical protein C4B24_00545 [Mycoplasma marinum]